MNPRYLLLLTATPVQNDMRELFNLATLVRPGTVGTFTQFRRDFLSGHDKRAPRNTPKLRELLQHVMIRTRRVDTDIAFAPRRVETLWVTQSPEERKLYRQVSDFVADSVRVGEHGPGRNHHFTLIVLQKEMGSSWSAAAGTLEKLARHPDGLDAKRLRALANRASVVQQEQTGAIAAAALQSLQPQKCIVFTQFRSQTSSSGRCAPPASSRPCSTARLAREESARALPHGVPVLVSTEAGEGRNLQFCQIVINYDLPWNPMGRAADRPRAPARTAHPVRVINLSRAARSGVLLRSSTARSACSSCWWARSRDPRRGSRTARSRTSVRAGPSRPIRACGHRCRAAQHLVFARRYQEYKERQDLFPRTEGTL